MSGSVTTGECFCGSITYEINGPLPKARACHCSRCRKAFNGASSAVCWVAPGTFRWTGGGDNLSTYMNREGVGLGFCRTCGSTLCGLYRDDVVCVTLGTMNGDPDIEIGEHIFVGSKAAWDEIGGRAAQFEAFPPER